ncbi:MAG: peptide-methionine (S)-S-oxide reductase MsrA [Asgard group archaeon]|nr:peptide-methionine (S)-S-oxide reductase MsrA [Asgard group archaeon]
MIEIADTDNKVIILGGGCFWCLEAVYNQIKGVEAISGYAGGTTRNPTYNQVVSGRTGHAEVVKVIYDSSVITLEQILEIFFEIHDPTTLNRQGNDIGTQYRSIVFYANTNEKEIIEKAIQKAQKNWKGPIVTEVQKLAEFFEAEDYHQKYYEKNPNQGYCRVIIKPKLNKLNKEILPKLEFLK